MLGSILGFTGTQVGMNALQKAMFVGLLARVCPYEFHHGDCVGADHDAHLLIRIHVPLCKIIIHPPNIDIKRAFCSADEILPPLPYLDRNKRIVMVSDALAACPKTRVEKLRSGTWSTVRFARKNGKQVHMVWP